MRPFVPLWPSWTVARFQKSTYVCSVGASVQIVTVIACELAYKTQTKHLIRQGN